MAVVTLKNAILSLFPSNTSDSQHEPLLGEGSTGNASYAARDVQGLESEIESNSTKTQNINEDNQSQTVVWGLFEKVDPRVMSDIIIGLSDGLTVPFALTAGLSSLGDSKLVITGGMAELVSGSISMGLGGFLAARSESEFYKSQVRKEKQLFFNNKELLEEELEDIFLDIGMSESTTESAIRDLSKSPKAMIDFIIRHGKGLEEPADGRQVTSALTIGLSYFFGGFIPLVPYFFTAIVQTGLIISVLVMGVTLFWFGYLKTAISMGEDCSLWMRVSEGLQMVLIGSIAAGSAWGLVRVIDTN
ncbi:BA75_00395T0 [Komagataella pastoris]|uniref:BA75_00395T0 n=1 Tax=Komagataella pastoris TaxID=4922 RepID=A0A1B2J7S6_PICPA|nr:BA75_00395T0 [Komagataella pastoris]